MLANGLAPAVAGLFALLGSAREPAALAAVASLAAAASDTVAGEVGRVLADRAYLIGTWRRVSLGTDGGLSCQGTLAGAGAALAIADAATGLIAWGAVTAVAALGFGGNLLDSLLGANWERRGWLNNNAVNLLSTCAAALLALR